MTDAMIGKKTLAMRFMETRESRLD